MIFIWISILEKDCILFYLKLTATMGVIVHILMTGSALPAPAARLGGRVRVDIHFSKNIAVIDLVDNLGFQLVTLLVEAADRYLTLALIERDGIALLVRCFLGIIGHANKKIMRIIRGIGLLEIVTNHTAVRRLNSAA